MKLALYASPHYAARRPPSKTQKRTMFGVFSMNDNSGQNDYGFLERGYVKPIRICAPF